MWDCVWISGVYELYKTNCFKLQSLSWVVWNSVRDLYSLWTCILGFS
jgi:hypothetical protein